MQNHPPGAGRSSFDLIDVERLFSQFGLKEGSVFLDLGCGKGNYSLAASKYVGSRGIIYAADLWKEGIEALKASIARKKIENIRVIEADVSQRLPIKNSGVDVCLLATVFHDLVRSDVHKGTLEEVKRILKDNGTLAVVEFKKIEGPPGPPIEIRLSPEELETMLLPYGFQNTGAMEIGTYHYLAIFTRRANP
jgi:ubiquinone/menaquinone biosynthesis C-methylase UbiE